VKKIVFRVLASALALAMILQLFPVNVLPVQADDTIPAVGSEIPVVNGGFETLAAGWASPWSTRFKDSSSNVRTSIDSTTSYSGSHSLKFEGLGTGSNRMEVQTLDGSLFSPYVTYELSARVKTDWTNGTGNVWFLIEYYRANGAWHSTTDNSAMGISEDTQGDWTELKTTFRVPMDAGGQVIIAPRFSNDSLGTVWVDDVKITVSGGPEPYRLDTDRVFPYPDEDGVNASVHVEPYYEGKPEAGAKVDFVLYDSETETKVAEQLNTPFTSFTANYFIPIAHLSQMKHKYTLVATIKDSGGQKLEEFSQNLYKYPRPKMMDSDGDINFGIFPGEQDEKFNPVIAYGVDSPSRFQMAKDAGTTVVFSYYYMERSANTWQALDDTGLKIMYNLRVPPLGAGHPDQIEQTKETVDEYKDDPRVFAWMVDDEPLGIYNSNDREAMEQKKLELEAAYVAIRNIDDNHPVYLVDFGANQNETRKYSDIFSFDAYVRGGNDTTSITNTIDVNLAQNNRRPVLNLVATYYYGFENGGHPTVQSIRNSVFRTFEAGGRGVGYYRIDDAFLAADQSLIAHLYDTHLWRPFSKINNEEVPLLFDLYVNGNVQILGEHDAIPVGEQGQANGLLWKNWLSDDGQLYVMAYNKGRNAHSVTIPLKNGDGNAIGKYMAVPVGLTEGGIQEGSGSMTLNLGREEAALYKITDWKTLNLEAEDSGIAATIPPVKNNSRQGTETNALKIESGVQSGVDFPGLLYVRDNSSNGGYLKVDGNVFNKKESFTITTRSAGWKVPSAYLSSGAISFVDSGEAARGKVLKLEAASGGEAYISIDIAVEAGGVYDIAGWLKSTLVPGSNTGPSIEWTVYDNADQVLGNGQSSYFASTADEWKSFSTEVGIPSAYSEAARAEFRVMLEGSGTVYFDDIQCFKQP